MSTPPIAVTTGASAGGALRVESLADAVDEMVETDFSVVRLDGDRERADALYEGLTSLSADDVAECIRWASALPSHVDIDQLAVKPRDQADAFRSHRAPRQEKT